MPDQDFQDRLQRIAGKSRPGSNGSSGGGHRPELRRLAAGSVLTTLGAYMVALAYLEYGAIGERFGIEWAVSLGLLGLATLAFGINLSIQTLRRIVARGPVAPAAPSAAPAPIAASAPGRGPNLVLMVVSVFVIFLGSGLVRFTNENYERLRADGGTQLTLAFGIAAFTTIIYGVVLFWRSFRKRPAPVSHLSEPLPSSSKSRLGPVLFGLALGIAACFSMFMAAAARLLNPATDNIVSGLALLAALALTLLTFLIGIIGLFRSGSALRRVPLYYLAGAILTYAAFRLFYIDLSTWPWFMSLMQ